LDRQIGIASGALALVVLYSTIILCVALSPWFSWEANALSDFGHTYRSNVAPIFNFGLLLTGALMTVYSLLALVEYAKKTAYFLIFSAFSLQLVATFNETFGRLHYYVSVLLFLSLLVVSLAFTIEKKSWLGLIVFLGAIGWGAYFAGIFEWGVAVPETISALSVTPWYLSALLKAARPNASSAGH